MEVERHGLRSFPPSTVCAAASVAWATVVASASWWWPLVTVDSGLPGGQPRFTAVAAGNRLALWVLTTPLAVALVVGLLVWRARVGPGDTTALTLGLGLAVVYTLACGVATLTLFFPIVLLPASALAVAAVLLAR